jgi:hypothetical protein
MVENFKNSGRWEKNVVENTVQKQCECASGCIFAANACTRENKFYKMFTNRKFGVVGRKVVDFNSKIPCKINAIALAGVFCSPRAGENIFRNGRKFKKIRGAGGKSGRFWPENTL